MSLPGRTSLVLTFIVLVGILSCRDTETVIDLYKPLSRRNWSYTERLRFPVKIEDAEKSYNIYVNLRHTPAYKYSNIFILVHTTGPDRKKVSQRLELKLALPDGEWLGKGSGDLFSYQVPFKKAHKFSAPGTYLFELEQNMRDNPLEGITDAGIRVEKAQ